MSSAPGSSLAELSDEKIAEIALKIIIYIVGVIGNLLVIFVIIFLQEYKKITHWYVLQMALADIIFLQNLPFKVGEDINGRWIHADWLCAAQQAVLYLTYYASIMFLVIMAVDRYLAVCHPMSSFVHRVRQPKIAYITALTTWVVAILLAIPVMLNSTPFGLMPTCKCRLQFPVNEDAYCVNAGFGRNETTMRDCRENVLPTVILGRCVNVTEHINDINSMFSFSAGNAVSSANATSSPAVNPFDGIDFGIFSLSGNSMRRSTNTSPMNTIPRYTTASTLTGTFPLQMNQLEINQPVASNNGIADFDLSILKTFFASSQSAVNGSSSTNSSNSTGTGFVIPPPSGASRRVLPTECHYDVSRTGWRLFTILTSVVMFFVPLLIISVCYGLIIVRLGASPFTGGSGNASTRKSDGEKRKVTILCALLTILFTIFWLPFHTVQLAKLVGIQSSDGNFCVRLVTGASMLVYLSSATNPYLYNFLGTFNKRMKQIKNSKRMQSLLSAAGITRLTSAARTTSSADNSKDKIIGKDSAIPMSSVAT